MANKIKLGARPKNFKLPVKFTLLDGSLGQIEVTYRYRTRKEWGALIDEIQGKAGAQVVPQAATDKPVLLAESLERSTEANADYILKIAEGWDLDDEFTRANLIQLGDECPAATRAIIEAYGAALNEGRLGN